MYINEIVEELEKIADENGDIPPELVIAAASAWLGWTVQLLGDKDSDEDVEGMSVGTDKYFEDLEKSYRIASAPLG